MKTKIFTINFLNYFFYIALVSFHIYGYKFFVLDGTWVISSIAFTSLIIIFLMFYWIKSYPGKKILYLSLAINFLNIVLLVPLFYGYALLSP